MSATYVVTSACVVAKLEGDLAEGYFYRGAHLPAGVPLAEKERLVGAGLVEVLETIVVEVPVEVPVTTTPATAPTSEPNPAGPDLTSAPAAAVVDTTAPAAPDAEAAPRRTRPRPAAEA